MQVSRESNFDLAGHFFALYARRIAGLSWHVRESPALRNAARAG